MQVIEGFEEILAGTNELRLGVVGLIRAGRLDFARKVVFTAIERGNKLETKLLEVFIEGALEAKAGADALSVLQLISSKSLPDSANLTVNSTQQLSIRAFIKTFDLERAAEALSLLPSLSEQVWTGFLSACIVRNKVSLALEVMERASDEGKGPSWLWNLTLERLSERLMRIPDLEMVLEAVLRGRKIWLKKVTLCRVVRRLMKARKIAVGYNALIRFKAAVSALTLSKVIRLLLDQEETSTVMDIMDLMRNGAFNKVDARQLELSTEQLKLLIALQFSKMDLLEGGWRREEREDKTQTGSGVGVSGYLQSS